VFIHYLTIYRKNRLNFKPGDILVSVLKAK
jgi:hypothetical protein